MNRVVEEQAATDPKYRKNLGGRPVRSDAKDLDDEALLAKLRSFGVALDWATLEHLCAKNLSAEEIVEPWLRQYTTPPGVDRRQVDWIWVSVDALWQRWFPHEPSFEMLDDKMQAGYELKKGRDAVAVARVWLDAWADVLHILDKAGMSSIEEFAKRFNGSQCLFNWIQDLEGELWAA